MAGSTGAKRRNVRSLIWLYALVLALAAATAFLAEVPRADAQSTIWPSTATPAVASDPDTSAVELGVKFRSDVDGSITGIRFYKGAANTGTHTGHLWTATGTLLATVTFTGETASGWQQANLTTPVAITANTVYVASYFAPAGRYAVTAPYFTSGVDNPPLHALADGVSGGNGVYNYGSSAFPDSTFNSSNYWVDVVFTASATGPPTVTSVTPTSGATSVATTTAVTATFSKAMNASTITTGTFTLQGSAGTVAGTVGYNATTRIATLTPSAALANGTTYTATVVGGASGVKDTSGTAMAANFVWSFTTAAAAGACPCTIWPSTATPAIASESDANAVELGVKFRSDVSGSMTGIRFYKGAGNTGTHTGHLWTATGTLLATATFTGETASGWQQANFPTPVSITANTVYVASYFAPVGRYAVTSSYFASTGVDNPPLHALANGVSGGNGVYNYGPSAFPSSSFNSTNYWVDVLFTTTGTPPSVTSVTPASGASGVVTGTTVTATFSKAMDATTINTSTFTLRGPTTSVTATVSYNATTQTATLTPSAALANGTTYTATVQGGTSGVKDTSGVAMAADFVWSFTTVSAPGACPCTIWPSTATPAVPSANDSSPVEVGVKFRADVNGSITALRFYKGAGNTGSHIGSLWTAAGTLLTSVTFTNETASGWQQVSFPSPVPITANATYVASYHTNTGHYSVTAPYFASGGVDNPPLHALADGLSGGNGVYQYGGGGFPTSTFNSGNYWVDVVFSTAASGDTTPPTITSTFPANGAIGLPTGTAVTATFSEGMDQTTINTSTFELRNPSNSLMAATVSYNFASKMATLQPTSALTPVTTYTARVKGGSAGVKDLAGNPLANDVTWSFTTATLPTQGPGGPILVVTTSSNPFGTYYAEILRAEGFNAFAVADIGSVTAATLGSYDVVILGEMSLSASQVAMFTGWVNTGGNLIAMRPDKQLAGLLGLTDLAATLSNTYLLVTTSSGPGTGIVNQTIQFHGTADRYLLLDATNVATLYSNATTPTTNPAVTLRSVGTSGGQVAAFTYDLARSVVYTRQGNPAWAGQERDGVSPIRSDDLFFGGAVPDWVDLTKVAIPQADEQQRLLANLILQMNQDRKPLPRFWYFPRGLKAVVVMTGDDHGQGGTGGRFDSYAAQSVPGCVVDNWECIRGTSYVYPTGSLSDALAAVYTAQGFEVSIHVQNQTNPAVLSSCVNFTPTSLESNYASQLSAWAGNFPSQAPPSTHRFHCIVWSDWSTQAETELRHGMRLDTNYYYFPAAWLQDRPGMFTGSGMPMRFTKVDGTMIDVYQATSQMTDESGQSFPFTVDSLLDKALGAEGYYGAFTANMHTDQVASTGSDAIVASAVARGVPIVSSRQMLTWLDGRNNSFFGSLAWSGTTLSFSVNVATGGNGLQAMLPTNAAGKALSTITRGGSSVPFTTQTIKGIQYAVFSATTGAYQATYTGP
jgi:hypothetical protein